MKTRRQRAATPEERFRLRYLGSPLWVAFKLLERFDLWALDDGWRESVRRNPRLGLREMSDAMRAPVMLYLLPAMLVAFPLFVVVDSLAFPWARDVAALTAGTLILLPLAGLTVMYGWRFHQVRKPDRIRYLRERPSLIEDALGKSAPVIWLTSVVIAVVMSLLDAALS